ncbi:hypothetical protein HPB48_002689 [Haemaphysalis longicornis]|uniref:Uncharacterized protein n=1 Tax=Haemaphysalis longicornis TaxID=44386 RepID=A0A9J6GRC6_HAELO|nr:hypothetical protein HPB48_002689 [Haemaphysalis longicornis]
MVDSQEKTENILSCPTDVKPPIPAKRKSLSDISKESPFSKSVLQEETLGSLKVVNEEMNTPLHENAESRLAVSGEMLGENDEYQTHDVLPLNERTEAMIPADNAVEKTIVLEDNENSLQLPEKELSAFQEPENRAMQGVCLPATKKAESTTADTMSHKDNMLLQSLNVDEIQETSQVSVRSNDGKENEETTQGRNFDCIENKNLQCSENERTHAVHPGSYETGESLEVAELTNVDEEPTSADQEGAVNRGMERANWSHGEADCQLGRLTEETNSTYKVEKGSENQELTNKTCKTEESVKFMSVESRFVENGTPKAENETSHDAFDVIEDAMVEADVKVPVIVFQEAYLEGEDEEERLRLRAYAEEVVSTVLSKCVAQLEENEHKFSGTENTKMNHDDLKQVTFSESSWGEGKENHTVALTERETLIEDVLDGNLRPIASRQSAFENAIPPENCQGNDVEEGGFETILTTSADKNFEEISKELTVSKREASLTEPEKSDGADVDLLRSVDKILETSVDDFNQPLFGVSEAVIRVRTQSKNEPDVESRHDASGKLKSFEVLTEQVTANKNGSNEVRPQDSASCNTMASEVPTEEVTANKNENKNLQLAEDVNKNISASEVLTAEVTANENESENLQPEDDATVKVGVSEVLTAEVMANEHESENVQPEGDIPGKVSASEVLTEEVSANENESANSTGTVTSNREMHNGGDDHPSREDVTQVLHPELSPKERLDVKNGDRQNEGARLSYLVVGIEKSNKSDALTNEETEMPTTSDILPNNETSCEYFAASQEEHNNSAWDVPVPERTVDARDHMGKVPTSSAEDTTEFALKTTSEKESASTEYKKPSIGGTDASEELGTKAALENGFHDDASAEVHVPAVGEESVVTMTLDTEYTSTEGEKSSMGVADVSEELGMKDFMDNEVTENNSEMPVPVIEESAVTTTSERDALREDGKSSLGAADISEELGTKVIIDIDVHEDDSVEVPVPVVGVDSAVTTTSEKTDASTEGEKLSMTAADESDKLGIKDPIDNAVHEDDSAKAPVPVLEEADPEEPGTNEEPGTKDSIYNAVHEEDSAKVLAPVLGEQEAVTTTSEKDAPTEGEKSSMAAADTSEEPGTKDSIDNAVDEDDSAKVSVPVLGEESAVTTSEKDAATEGEKSSMAAADTSEEPGTKDSIDNAVHEDDSAKVSAPVLGEESAVTTTSEKDAPTEGEKSSMAAADTSEEPGTKDSIDNAVDEDDSAKVSMPVLGEESAVTTTSEKDAPMKGEKSSMVAADTSEEPVTKEFIGNELYEDYSAEVPCLGVGETSAVTTTSEEENASTEGKKTSSMGVTEASQELGTNDFIETAVHEDDSANVSVPLVGESAKVAQEDVDEVNHTTVETANEASSLRQYSGRTDYDISEGWEPKAADNNATILHFDGSALKDQDPTVLFNSDANKSASSSNISIKNEFAAQQTPQEHSQLTGENSSISDNMYPHSDKDSLGALSTVYENSLEDAKFSVEENITGTDATTKFSNNEVVDTTASPELSLYNTADTAGGIFQENESNNENDQLLEPSESTDSSRSCPLQRATNDVHTQGADGVLCGPTDSDNVSARIGPVCIPDNYSAVERETSQIPEDSASMQEFEDKVIGQEQVLSNNLQSTTQSEVSHDSQRANTDNDANHENEVTVVQKEERRTSADCHQNEVVAAFDTFSERTEGQIEVISEHREPRPPNEHQRLHRNDQASEDEVATIDFSDEELQSLDQVSSQNCEYFTDLQNSNDDSVSHEVQKRRPEECVQNNGVSLEPRFVAVIDTDHKESITNDTVAETQGQFGRSQEECSVHGILKSPDHISTLDTSLTDSQDKSLFDSRQATVGSLKTAVLVHEATKLETVEWSEDPLNSVATEADFSSDIYEQAADGQNASISDAQNCEQVTDGLLDLPEGNALSSPGDEPEISQPTNIDQELEDETAKLGDDLQEREQKSSNSDVEDAIVPQHIDTSNDKPSSTDSEVESERGKTILDENNRKAGKDANTDLKDAIEKFSTIISADSARLDVNEPRSQEPVEGLHGPVVTEVTDQQDEAESKGHSSIPTDAKLEHDSDIETKAENAKPGHSENILRNGDQNSLGHDGTQRLKADTTHSVTESVEKSERTEREDADSNERSRLTRIFHRTVLRTESTRTVRKTRSFMPYSRDKDAAHTRTDHEAEVEPMDDTRKPVEETFVSREAFDAMSVPRRGLGPVASTETVRTVRDVGVQALPSTTEKEVQVEFNEHDCIARLVELQIAMNEQEEVRRQDMKAACELVEKLEAMQLSETLMRSQIRAMDVERREQSAREARLRDELQAWQETVQQQQLLLQQLKEDLDDT